MEGLGGIGWMDENLECFSQFTFWALSLSPPTLERILAACHCVLYKQLSAWMLHGLLNDEQREFFIERAEPAAAAEPTATVEVS